jgi:hypothetical protein
MRDIYKNKLIIYQTWQMTSPPIFLYLASLFVIRPFDVEIIDIPYPP